MLLTNTQAVTMQGAGYGLIADAAIALDGGKIAWVGPEPYLSLVIVPTTAAAPNII